MFKHSIGLPIAAKKSLPRKGNPGRLARKIILKSGWMGMDVGRLLAGEPSVQCQREHKMQAVLAKTPIYAAERLH